MAKDDKHSKTPRETIGFLLNEESPSYHWMPFLIWDEGARTLSNF